MKQSSANVNRVHMCYSLGSNGAGGAGEGEPTRLKDS